jgi:hypothetical protein
MLRLSRMARLSRMTNTRVLWLLREIAPEHPLYGSRLKIERANAHLNQLVEILDALDKPESYSVVREFDAKRKELVIRACLIRPLPPEVPLIFGDCIHNLRSSLDYAVNELIRHSGHKPSKQTAFPIFSNRDGPNGYLCKSPAMLQGVPQPARELIETMQPYHGADAKPIPATHATTLQDLWNKDKHRALLLTPPGMWFDYIAHNRSDRQESGITMRLTADQDCAEYVAADATPEEHFHPEFTVRVTLGEGGPWHGWPIRQTSEVLCMVVAEAVAEFVPFFA